jgi:hypothetical protein
MRKLIFTVLLSIIILAQVATACEWAVQSRILPIGMVNEEIIAVNIRMKRDIRGPDTKKTEYWWWLGEASLIAINPSNFNKTKTYQSENIAWYHTNFQENLDELYNRYIKLGKGLQNLDLFKPQSITTYNFQGKPPIKFNIDPGDTTAHFTFLDDNSAFPIHHWDCTDTNRILHYISAKTIAEYEEQDEFNVPRYFQIGSIRTFKLGEYKLLMIHIRYGTQFDLDGNEIFWEGSIPSFDKLKNCAYEESAMWHGIGIDIPILMK